MWLRFPFARIESNHPIEWFLICLWQFGGIPQDVQNSLRIRIWQTFPAVGAKNPLSPGFVGVFGNATALWAAVSNFHVHSIKSFQKVW